MSWEEQIESLPNFRGKEKKEQPAAGIIVLYESLYMNRHERRKARKFGMHVDLHRNVPYLRAA